tara:strand:+ start:1515 stop:1724 length:210 start_codon:yes stop_codon:yes gene_type:complete
MYDLDKIAKRNRLQKTTNQRINEVLKTLDTLSSTYPGIRRDIQSIEASLEAILKSFKEGDLVTNNTEAA